VLTVGIDIGTTNIKGIVFTPEGKKVASVSRPTRIHYQGTEIADFHPDEIWEDVKATLCELSSLCPHPQQIKALSFASFGEAGLLIDKKGDPLAPSIAWFDHRSNEIIAEWRKTVDEYEIFQIAGVRISSVSSLAKILWEKKNRSDVYPRAKKWLFVPSYIIFKLTGEYRTDYSMASRSMLFDIHEKAWSEKICRLADVPMELLPPAAPSGTPVGEIPKRLASSLGLTGNIVVVLGGHDHPCGAFSTGMRQEGDIVNSSGTVDAVYALIDPSRIDRNYFNAGVNCGCHVAEGKTYLLGGTLTAGILIDWFIENFYKNQDTAKENIYDLLVKDAGESPVGSRGIVVLPHLRGSYTPHNDPHSKGAILGLRTTHNYKDLIRALFESLSLEFRVILDKYNELTGDPYPEVKCIGGGSKNRFWTQLKADVADRKMIVDKIQENTSFGAAILAGIGAGIYHNIDEAFEVIKRDEDVVYPNPKNTEIYNRLYDNFYRGLYAKLMGVNKDMEEILR
jgi:xylulokinase